MFEQLLDPFSPFFWLIIIIFLGAIFAFIARYFTTYVKFVYPNAKYEAIGNPFLQEKELNILIENSTLANIKDRLNALRDYQLTGETASALQKSLDDSFLQTIQMIQNDSTRKLHEFFELYLKKQDLIYIKNEFKNLLSHSKKRQTTNTPLLMETQEFLQKLHDTQKEHIPELLSSYGFSKELIEELTKETPDFLTIDILFDKYLLQQFKEVQVPYKCEQAKQEYVKTMIDVMTVKHILRAKELKYSVTDCKKMFLGEGFEIARWRFDQMAEETEIPEVISRLEATSYYPALTSMIERYHTEHSVQVFETAVDSVFLNRMKEISLKNYLTLGPTLRFLISKEYEIQNLKVIVKGIGENISTDLIKKNFVTEVKG